MGSKKTTTAHTANTLPDWLTSPFQQATAQATNLQQRPAIGEDTQGVLDRTFADSANGSALANQGGNLLSQVAGGNFGSAADSLVKAANGGFLTAESNPYIKGVADQGADAAQARINAQFGAAGRSNGSGLYAQLFGKGIADAANNVYAQNYENERQRQQAAAGGLLSTQLGAANSIPALVSAGLASDQAGLAAGQYQDNAEAEKLRQYTSLLSQLASPFGIQDSKQTQSSSGLGSVLGTIAQLGGALGSAFTGGASLLGGAAGAASPIINSAATSLNLPSWLPK